LLLAFQLRAANKLQIPGETGSELKEKISQSCLTPIHFIVTPISTLVNCN
jgi:hypothetical protein